MARRSYETLYYDTTDELDAWKALAKEERAMREAAEKHIAELEAQSDERNYKKISRNEKPTGKVLVYDPLLGHYQAEWSVDHWEIDSQHVVIPSHWRPLPPPPVTNQ